MEGYELKAETDGSATISDDSDGATTDTDVDAAIGSISPLASTPFSEGEKVLAFHNKQVYEAKVQKKEFRMKEWKYFVHYPGWNKNWDEWVGLDRLMKYTEENFQKQQVRLGKQRIDKNEKSVHGSENKPRNTTVPRSKKRKNDSVTKDKGTGLSGKRVLFHIPSTLKKQLVDDCEFITQLGQLVKLPRNPNINNILDKYLNYRLADSEREILDGLRCYFDKALFAMLLYKDERQQYEQATADNIAPSTVYGAEHLLRLFVKLPEILIHANIEEETLQELQQRLQDFLKFLQQNQGSFFVSTYQARREGSHDHKN
ncbi:protein MRG2-like isoform X2 [Impatiens glandulifera]|uniref:protein MRG2-like isoform X2 n=1 Tax=Impatiens glandulifera TaxID=253017 RepID=UPI001FB0E8EC|nr:protein MRG2-like isoform X2 [Impatiens glandulifera]